MKPSSVRIGSLLLFTFSSPACCVGSSVFLGVATTDYAFFVCVCFHIPASIHFLPSGFPNNQGENDKRRTTMLQRDQHRIASASFHQYFLVGRQKSGFMACLLYLWLPCVLSRFSSARSHVFIVSESPPHFPFLHPSPPLPATPHHNTHTIKPIPIPCLDIPSTLFLAMSTYSFIDPAGKCKK